MKHYNDLEYLKLRKWRRFFYKIACFFVGIPGWFKRRFVKLGRFFKKLGIGVKNEAVNFVSTFVHGDWKTRTSYVVMGFGNFTRGQVGRGLLFFFFELIFILYMIFYGGHWLGLMSSLGERGPTRYYDPVTDGWLTQKYDDSFKILLYSVLSIFFMVAFVYTWRLNIKQNQIAESILDTKARKEVAKERKKEIEEYVNSHDKYVATDDMVAQRIDGINKRYDEMINNVPSDDKKYYKNECKRINKERRYELKYVKDDPGLFEIDKKYREKTNACGKPLKSGKEDLHSLVDDQFHKTLLSLPLLGILVFTVLPTFFMILIAFTNYDGAHDGYNNQLFHWVGLDNFNTMLNWQTGNKAYTAAFGEILAWTIMWAFFATFTNYFLGMVVAMVINKKGIKLKKLWRIILVLTIAIPQFISLLYVSKMFADNGIILTFLRKYFGVSETFSFIGQFAKPWVARTTVIVINIWIGIPYLMLIATGVLMNIPADLYESAQIDGANVWQQYTKITLPYMLFVTGPYLLTSFIGNMNNFNVIYLLTGGGPTIASTSAPGGPGHTDLLITWLFKLTTQDSAYSTASVIGILVFIVVAIFSLVVYNIMPSTRNEEDFQ